MSFSAGSGLPRWLDGPGAGGAWKQSPEDFEVEELPFAPPTGAGEHQWFRIEKTGHGTLDVAEALAKAAGVPLSVVGYAGMKDREARTIQEFTVQLGSEVESLPEGMRILERGRTARRLRVGQLAGNRFGIRVRGGDASIAAERIARLEAVPNYYGMQRVGGRAPRDGRAIVLGGGPRLRFHGLKFALSAYQSVLFNRVLVERRRSRLDGDLDEGGIPTGPIFGSRMRWPEGAARELEERILAAEERPPDAWARFGKLTQGSRRPLWLVVRPELEPLEDGFRLRFQLPAGAYATVLLEEIL